MATGKAFKSRSAGEGRSTAELFSEARAGLRELERLMEKRRNRDQASVLLTDTFTAVQEIAHRFAAVSGHFDSRPAARTEDEDERDGDHEPLGLVELFAHGLSEAEEAMAGRLSAEPPAHVREKVEWYHRTYRSIEVVRAEHYRSFIDYIARGCTQVKQVAANLLTLSRRVRPESMKALGISQVEVSRKLGERRATTSAREKRLVETPLKANGSRGTHLLGGTKTEEHRAKCRVAQKGNTNRRDAHARQKAAESQDQ